jgi:hypothetical protein
VVASLYGSDVVLSNARNGQVIRVITCGEGEVCLGLCVVLFCLVWNACLRSCTANVEAGVALYLNSAFGQSLCQIAYIGHWVRGLDPPFLTYLIYVRTSSHLFHLVPSSERILACMPERILACMPE